MEGRTIDPDSIDPADFIGSDDEDSEGDIEQPDDDPSDLCDVIGEEADVTSKQDKGVLKTITAVGAGAAKPSRGAEVTVHYTGTLEDGTCFDCSRKKGRPFTFRLGEGEVIKGWDVGVASMRLGERSLLKCAPDYAYGAEGAALDIPPGAALLFDMELLAWTEWKDVSERKDGSIMKKITKAGEGWRNAEFDSVVTASWKLTLKDSEEVLQETCKSTFTIGAEEVAPRGLERVIQTMLKGEEALVQLNAAEGFGEKGHAELGVPPGACLSYAVTIDDVVFAPAMWELKLHDEKIKHAVKLKEEGNAFFKQGWVSRAVKKYQAAIAFLSTQYEASEAQQAESKSHKAAIYLNISACGIKAGLWDAVLENVEEALQIQPNNMKALLRRGKAYSELDRWRESKLDLQTVIEAAGPEAADAKKELAKLTKKIKAHDDKQRGAFQGMFDKIRLRDATIAATNASIPAEVSAEEAKTSDS
mmetsp:Transcript_71591/g.126013  ORF Transcript_71591/g.126013 Transcript_71591/m.126013 type:complete len:474 (-) Transcript_71591:607-2028(-)